MSVRFLRKTALLSGMFLLTLVMFGQSALPKQENKEKWAKPNLVVVAPGGGGDYTRIQDALNALDPDADRPYVIEVAAGTYVESVQMKSYVHLKGAGRDLVVLKPDTSDPTSDLDFACISAINLTGVKISGITFTGDTGGISGAFGILDQNSSPIITENRFTGFQSGGIGVNGPAAIFSEESSPRIYANDFVENKRAISLFLSTAVITENVFEENGGGGLDSIYILNSDAFISQNTFLGGRPIHTDVEGPAGDINCSAAITENTFTGFGPVIRNDASYGNCSTRIARNVINGNPINPDQGIVNDGTAVISENTIYGYAVNAILNNAAQTVISSNILFDNGAFGGDAIATFASAVISGNYVKGVTSGSGGSNSGILATGATSFTTITGNTILDNNRFGVRVGTGAASVIGNTFANNNEGCIDGTAAATANLCDGSLELYGSGVAIKSMTDLDIEAGQDLNTTATNTNIDSTVKTTMDSSETEIKASGTMTVEGALIKLN